MPQMCIGRTKNTFTYVEWRKNKEVKNRSSVPLRKNLFLKMFVLFLMQPYISVCRTIHFMKQCYKTR